MRFAFEAEALPQMILTRIVFNVLVSPKLMGIRLDTCQFYKNVGKTYEVAFLLFFCEKHTVEKPILLFPVEWELVFEITS